MPMPADQAGVSEEKIQVAAGQMANGAASGAAIVEAVPVMQGRPQPRTLVSAMPNGIVSGEVSAGGFTPGSMTLSSNPGFAEVSMRNHDALDPTIVHAIPKRNLGKYIVVIAAFLLVFGTGLMLLRSRGDGPSTAKTADTATRDTPKKDAADARTADAARTAEAPAATPSSTVAAASATATATAKATADRVRPVAGVGKVRTARPEPSDKTTKPEATVKPTATGEDLTNPYR